MRSPSRLLAVVGLLASLLAPLKAASASATAPDLSIATRSRWGAYIGAGIMDPHGNRQVVSSQVPPAKSRKFWIKITDPGATQETFRVSGAGAGSLFGVTYYDDQTGDVTAGVTAGTYEVTVQPGKHSYLELVVSAAANAQTADGRTLWVHAENVGASELVDEVRAAVSVPPIRVWAVNYTGSLRCTATFPDRQVDPGSKTGVTFSLTNLTDRTLPPQYAYGYLVFRDASGTKLWDTSPKFEGPTPGTGSIGPHETVKVFVYDTRVRWSGPLSVTPVCDRLRLTMPTVVLPVASPGAPASVDDAIHAAVAVSESPFQACPPGPNGAATTGSFDAPDERSLPPLTLRCWAEVRQEDGFDVVSLELVSPSDAPDYTIPEDTFVFGPAPLPGTDNMLAARWSFVVTADAVIPYYAIMFDRALGSGTSYFYELHDGAWRLGGYGPCGYEGAALATTGDWFFLDWIAACTQTPSSTVTQPMHLKVVQSGTRPISMP